MNTINNYIMILVLAAVGYSVSRFVRNYLTDTVHTNKNLPSLALATSGVHIIIMVTLFAIFGQKIFVLPASVVLVMFIAGAINVSSQFPFLRAMRISETVEVTMFSQSAPIIALILGFILLQQQITGKHLAGFIMILIAAFILVFSEKNKRSQSAKLKTARLVIFSTFLFVLSDIIMLIGLKSQGSMDLSSFSKALFYFELGSFLTVIFLAIINPSWRKTFQKTYLQGYKSTKNVIYILVHNFSYAFAEVFYKIALISAPAVALFAAVNQVSQLVITFLLGVVLSWFLPKFGREKLSKHILFRHLVAAIFIGMGIILVA